MSLADSPQMGYPALGANAPGDDTKPSEPGLKDKLVNSRAAADAVTNHPTVQNIANGPVAQKAKEEANKTSAQFTNVANSRQVPDQKTATGQPLTQYHSLFFNVLSWQNPRVTGIAYATIVTFIFFTRYVPVLKYFFKATYTILGIVAAAEIGGKLVFENGLASRVRPRRYYTIPRESLEAATEDLEQFANFFVIEFQRIVFAENVYATISAFSSALIAYWLVKIVPKWGLALIATTVVFFVPLIYIQNRELIDGHLENASTIINQQASQVRDLAAQHTGRAGEIAKSTVSQYSARAQELMGQAQAKASSVTGSQTSTGAVKKEDFPAALTSTPAPATSTFPSEKEPLVAL